VDPEVIARLQQYDWPGNMREFQNAVEKLVNVSGQSRIGLASLPDEILEPGLRRGPRAALPGRERRAAAPEGKVSIRDHRASIKQALADQEHQEILALMARSQGNLSETARALGISRTSLYRKLGRT
jgi:transcriptional regulator with PAS, ATPase and Fis domain